MQPHAQSRRLRENLDALQARVAREHLVRAQIMQILYAKLQSCMVGGTNLLVDEQVPGVWVGMEEPELEQLLQEAVDARWHQALDHRR